MEPLKQGSKGTEVAKLQTTLKSAGFDPGNIDSDFGPKTASALSAYQTANGLKADSIFGPITSGKLYGTAGATGAGAGATTGTGGKSPYDLASGFSQPADYDNVTGRLTEAGKKKGLPEVNPDPNPAPVVGTSESARAAEIQKIKDEMEGGLDEPTPYKSLEQFDKLRAEKGVVEDENELNSIRSEAAQIQQTLREFASTAGEGVSEASRIGAVSEKERNAQFRLDSLNLRETAVTNRLNSKNSYINTVLGLGKEDYQTAYTKYTNEYNKNVKAIDLYNTKLNDKEKDALTSFTTITNLLKDSDVTKLDPSISTQLDTLALQAGLPKGLFQQVIAATPNEKILAPVMVDTETGKDIYFYTQGADGKPSLKSVQHLPGEGSGDGGGGGGSGPGFNSKGAIKFTPEEKKRLIAVNFTPADIAQIQSDINSYGVEKTTEGMDEKQKKALQNVLSGVTPTQEQAANKTTKLTRENVSSLFGIPDDSSKTGFLGFGKTNSEKLTDILSSIKKYQDVGYSDEDILKMMKE